MSRIIKNASLLLGRNLRYVNSGFIEIGKNGKITRVGPADKLYSSNGNGGNAIDSEGLLIIPGFINAHTHIGDSLGKDLMVDSEGINAKIHPVYGAKRVILGKSKPDHLKMLMRSSVISMMKKGIVAFADFREGGTDGITLLGQAMSALPIKCIVLGRIELYFDLQKTKEQHEPRRRAHLKLSPKALQQASKVLSISNGLGLSGANENTDLSLRQYKQVLDDMMNEKRNRKLLLAIHAAESKESVEFSFSVTGKTEVARIVQHLDPDFIVHMTNATNEDISLVTKRGTGVVICPRANGVLGAGIPRVEHMLERGVKIAIGTDNVMLNSPDMFREMDYVWKASRATETGLISAREILKMATINAAQILGLNSGCIEVGRQADLLFIDKKHIDLYPIHNPYASIVNRAGSDSIKGMMIDGRMTDGAEL